MRERRVLVLGLDAVDVDLLRAAVAAGRAPNLAALLAAGRAVELGGPQDEWTAASFLSMHTGCHGRDHTVYRDTILEAGTYDQRPARGSDSRIPCFWEVASARGIPTTVVGVYAMPLAERFTGTQVAGWGSVDPYWNKLAGPRSSPPEVLARLERAVGRRAERWGSVLPTTADGLHAVAAAAAAGLRHQAAGIVWLARNTDWRLFVGSLSDVHDASHYLWHVTDPSHPDFAAWAALDPTLARALPALVGTLDECVGAVVAAVRVIDPDAHVVLTSPYSFAPNNGTGVLMAPVLLAGGWSAPRQSGETSGLDARTRVLVAGRRAVHRLFPRWLRPLLGRLVPRDAWLGRISLAHLDMSRTRAFCLEADGSIAVRLNIRGREPDGTVPQEEYRATVAELIGFLTGVVDVDTGEPIASAVEATMPDGSQPPAGLPDVVGSLTKRPGLRRVRLPSGAEVEVPSDPTRTGLHRRPGFLISSGPGSGGGGAWSNGHLFDVAPHVLGLLGLAPPQAIDA